MTGRHGIMWCHLGRHNGSGRAQTPRQMGVEANEGVRVLRIGISSLACDTVGRSLTIPAFTEKQVNSPRWMRSFRGNALLARPKLPRCRDPTTTARVTRGVKRQLSPGACGSRCGARSAASSSMLFARLTLHRFVAIPMYIFLGAAVSNKNVQQPCRQSKAPLSSVPPTAD